MHTTKSYAYCFRGGASGKDVILYEYNTIKHKSFVNNWFAVFSGTLHCYGHPFFDLLFESGAVSPSFCNTHARRKFVPIAIASKGNGLAKQAMRFYKRRYKIQRKAKDEKMSQEQRYKLRQQRSKPLIAECKQWLDEHCPTVPPKTSLGKAFAYTFKFWHGLCEFLNDGRLEADNNFTEQEIKPFVIARKNFMFCSSVKGAEALCLHFSLIRTAKRQGLLARDDESSYLTLDLQDDDPMNQLQGHFITYRIAVVHNRAARSLPYKQSHPGKMMILALTRSVKLPVSTCMPGWLQKRESEENGNACAAIFLALEYQKNDWH